MRKKFFSILIANIFILILLVACGTPEAPAIEPTDTSGMPTEITTEASEISTEALAETSEVSTEATAETQDVSSEAAAATSDAIPIETVTVDDFSMNYFKFGTGEKTFVMLPGLSAQGVMGAAEQIAAAYQNMTEDFTVYVFDPRNELPEKYDIHEMAEDTVEVLDELGLDHVYVMEASMGGMTALDIAVNHPGLIEKMVLASSAVKMGEAQFKAIDEWIALAKEGDAEALYLKFGEDIYPKEIFEKSRDALAEASKTVTDEELKNFVILAESMRGFDVTNDMEKIECPILAVNDKDDHVLGEEAGEIMKEFMNGRSDREFYLYEGYGHAFYDTAPDFKDKMLGFFQISETAAATESTDINPDDPSGFVLLSEAVPDAILEIRYYSTYNFVGDRIDGYEEPLAFLTKEAA